MNNRGFYIESASMMVNEARRLGIVHVDVSVAQDYLLNHLYQDSDEIEILPTKVPGVMMVRHTSQAGF